MLRGILIMVMAVVLLPFFSIGQTRTETLTLRQVIALLDKDYSEINDFLINRDWDFEEAEKETADNYGFVTWAIRQNRNNLGAMGFFEITYSEDQGNVKATYQCSTQETFKALKAEAISLKMQNVKSGMYDGGNLYSDYVGANYAVRFESGKGDYNNLIYQIDVYQKDHYYRTRYDD